MNPALHAADWPQFLRHQQRLARLTGALYVVVAVLGMFAPGVLQALTVPADAAATTANLVGSRWLFTSGLVAWILLAVADAAIAVTLLLLLQPVSRRLSVIAAAVRLVYAVMLAVLWLNLLQAYVLTARQPERVSEVLQKVDTFNAGFVSALMVFGVHVVVVGLLLFRSRYVPRALAALLVVGGVGYVVHTVAALVAPTSALASSVVMAPAAVGELGLTAWLLVKGVSSDQGRRAMRFTASPAPRVV